MSDITNSYRELQEHLDKMPIGYPSTVSQIEISIIKHLFTPIEAKIASKLGWMPESLRKIHKKTKKIGLSKNELRKHLDSMGNRGLIYNKQKGRRYYYRSAMFAIGFFEFQVGSLDKETMKLFHEYWDGEFGKELLRTQINQLRTVPVEKSIPINKKIYSFERIKDLIKRSPSPFGVAECICRKGQDLLGNKCKRTELRESCLVFREVADYYISHGNARPISREESLKILEKAEKAGLILQPGNSKRLSFICTCCACCCEDLKSAKRHPKPVDVYITNFYSQIDQNNCIGCGNCANGCNMDAITVTNKKANVDLKRCIGCGQCVIQCQNNCIVLKKKKKKTTPPRTQFRLFLRINSKKNGRWSSIKIIINLIRKMNLYYLIKKEKRMKNED